MGKDSGLNRKIDEAKPWIMAKNGETDKLKDCLNNLVNELLNVNYMLSPFLPETAKKINVVFEGEIRPPEVPLFPKD